jgi:hypothetical protein
VCPGGQLKRTLPEEYISDRIDRLNNRARQRHRLFLAYIDFDKGPFFLRVGRQVLAWGETDIFRLLDNINPLDDSFGGFFIALDERRLPIEMVRSSYRFGSWGPFQDAFLEGFVANGNAVATVPGIPNGSSWSPGGIAFPNPSVNAVAKLPDATAVRGGARLVFTAYDVTTTLAHYYTYFDVPGVRFILPGVKDCGGSTGNTASFLQSDHRGPDVPASCRSAARRSRSRSRSSTRSSARQAAYFQDDRCNRQGQGNSNDAIAAKGTRATGGWWRRTTPKAASIRSCGRRSSDHTGQPQDSQAGGPPAQRDSYNCSVGFDINRFVRMAQPDADVHHHDAAIYKHVFDRRDLVAACAVSQHNVGKNPPSSATRGQPDTSSPGSAAAVPRTEARLPALSSAFTA